MRREYMIRYDRNKSRWHLTVTTYDGKDPESVTGQAHRFGNFDEVVNSMGKLAEIFNANEIRSDS